MRKNLHRFLAFILVFAMVITTAAPASVAAKSSLYVQSGKSVYYITKAAKDGQCGKVVLMKWGTGTTATVKEYIQYKKKSYRVVGVAGTYNGKKKANSVFGSAVKKVTLPDSITFLGKNTCNGCKKLAGLTIPKNVTRIEKGAVNNCPSLKKIIIRSRGTKYAAKDTFTKIHKKAVIYIPTGIAVKDSYKTKLQKQLSKGQKVKYNIKAPEVKGIENGSVLDGKSVQTNKVSLKGVAFSNSKIKKVTYQVTDEDGKKLSSGTCSGTANWKLSTKLKDGTNTVELTALDASGKKGTTAIYIVKASEEIRYQDQVKVESAGTSENAAKSISDITEDGDYVCMTVEDDSPIIGYIEENKLKEGDVYLLQQNSELPAGFCGIYQGIEQIRGKTVVRFQPAGLADIYDGKGTIDLSGTVSDGNPVAYANILGVGETRFNAGSTKKVLPDWLSVENSKKETTITISMDERIIYDGDGNEKTTNDQLKLNGSYQIKDLRNDFYYAHERLSVKQLYEKLSYEGMSDIRLTAGAKLNTKSVVKKLNANFDNKKNFGILKLEGIDLSDSIILGVVGFDVVTELPVVSTFKTLQDISESDPLSPVLFMAFIVHLDGSLDVQLTLGYTETTYNEKGFNLQKPGYVGKYGAFNKSQGSSKKLLGFNFQTFNKTGKSKGDTSGKPERKLYLNGNGKARLEFGAGLMGAAMIDGLIPAGVSAYPYFEADGSLKGNVEVTLPYEAVQAEGEYELNAQIGIAGKAAFALTQKLRSDKKFSAVLWEKHLEGKASMDDEENAGNDDSLGEEGDSGSSDRQEDGSSNSEAAPLDDYKNLTAGQALTMTSVGNRSYSVWGLDWYPSDGAIYDMIQLNENGETISGKRYWGSHSGWCAWRSGKDVNGKWIIKVHCGTLKLSHSFTNLLTPITFAKENGAEIFDNPMVLNMKSITLEKGKTYKLEASFAFDEYTLKNIKFTSKNPKVADVAANGTVTAVKKGKTTIVVTDRGGFRSECTVIVK